MGLLPFWFAPCSIKSISSSPCSLAFYPRAPRSQLFLSPCSGLPKTPNRCSLSQHPPTPSKSRPICLALKVILVIAIASECTIWRGNCQNFLGGGDPQTPPNGKWIYDQAYVSLWDHRFRFLICQLGHFFVVKVRPSTFPKDDHFIV